MTANVEAVPGRSGGPVLWNGVLQGAKVGAGTGAIVGLAVGLSLVVATLFFAISSSSTEALGGSIAGLLIASFGAIVGGTVGGVLGGALGGAYVLLGLVGLARWLTPALLLAALVSLFGVRLVVVDGHVSDLVRVVALALLMCLAWAAGLVFERRLSVGADRT